MVIQWLKEVVGAGSTMWREIPFGRSNSYPILDTRTYEVELKDGSMSTYSTNVIAEIMYAQCDDERHKYVLFGSILGMPYRWRIKMWLYVGEVQNIKPQKVGTSVSNRKKGQQNGRDYQTSRSSIPFRLQSTHLHRLSDISLPSIGG